LLAYLNKEANFERVKQILAVAQKSGDFVLMNEINIGETYYILATGGIFFGHDPSRAPHHHCFQ